MAITTEMAAGGIRRIIALNAAGASAASIAATANTEGIPVPREINVDHRRYRYPSGHALATAPGDPGKWDGAAVTEFLAISAISGNTWAAAGPSGVDAPVALTVA